MALPHLSQGRQAHARPYPVFQGDGPKVGPYLTTSRGAEKLDRMVRVWVKLTFNFLL